MPKFKIDTSKSEYTPVIVEINGKEFEVREFDRDVLRELNKFDQLVRDGDMETPYRRLEYLLNLKENHPSVNKLKARQVNRLTNWIIRVAYSPDEAEMEGLTPAEKKKKSPGGSKTKQ